VGEPVAGGLGSLAKSSIPTDDDEAQSRFRIASAAVSK
jgi:hypothetical protein